MNLKRVSDANRKPPLIIIVGPTGIGKTRLSIALAQEFSGEIVNADSMQVYKLMDVGTAKPSPEERKLVPHHLLDIVYPDEPYNAARYRSDAEEAIKDISSRGKLAVAVGGTGLYIKALTRGLFPCPATDDVLRHALTRELEEKGLDQLYAELRQVDPDAAQRIHPNDKVRILRAIEVFRLTGRPISVCHSGHGFSERAYDTLKIGLELDRDKLHERIELRAHHMVDAGLIDEVNQLVEAGYSEDLKPMQSLGYRHVVRYRQKKSTFDEMLRSMIRDTRRYAKRQLTWFRGDPEITWHHPSDISGISREVNSFLRSTHSKYRS